MNVAGYVRVSSDSQTENYSIPEQKDAIESYCKLRGWNLIQIFVDGGYTGANIDRPALTDLRNHLQYYDLVLVFKIDRLSRSQKDMLALIEEFSHSNVKFASIQENFDTNTPLGMAMVGILSAFAQLERENIKERMKLGRRGRIKKGLWRAGSRPPIGYDYINGHLVIRDDEAIQIQKIFELFLQGHTINQIRIYMHEHYKNRYSSWNSSCTVSHALRNEIYIGKLPSLADGISYDGEHEPIIDEVTFRRAQQLLNARMENFDQYLKHPFKAKYLLTGMLYCGDCGGRASIVHSHGYKYYGCGHTHNSGYKDTRIKCKTPRYNQKKLDKLIIDEIMNLSFDENAIKALIKPRKEIDHRKALKSLQAQKSRLIDLYSVSGIELEDLTARLDSITEQINSLQRDKPPAPDLTFEQAKEYFKDANKIFQEDASIEQQRAILQALIKKIVITEDGLEIHWRFE